VKQKHFIGKLSLDVQAARLRTATDGFELQAEISEVLHGDLTAALEGLLDQFVSPHEVLKIERLDIVIPSLSFNNWQKELTPSVLRALEEALERLLHFPTAHTVVSKNKIDKTTLEQSLFDAWVFFLKTGQTPQTASNETEWQTVSLASVATNSKSVEILRGLLRSNATVLERLVLQHNDTFLEALAEGMSGKKQTETAALLHTFEGLWIEPSFMQYLKNTEPLSRNISSITPRDIREMFWKMVFKQLAQGNAVPDLALFIKNFVELLFHKMLRKGFISFLSNIVVFEKVARLTKAKDGASKKQTLGAASPTQALNPLFIQAIKKATTHSTLAQLLIDFFIKEITQHTSAIASNLNASMATELETKKDTKDKAIEDSNPLNHKDSESPDKQPVKQDIKNKDALSESIDAQNKAALENKLENNAESGEDATDRETEDLNPTLPDDAHWVASNAGVVLLHPFLKPFFDSINLLKEGKFDNNKDRRRAAALIHYLATGTTEMAEYEMTLPKLLVGLPLQNPVDRQLILTDTERTEADNLLRAVLNHWKALGSTSPAGLREGFLQRSGKLTHREDGWLLQVETKTLDILIDKLPWGMGIIRLGWMPEMLFVEWH
jgi:hypothetical protein